MLLLIFATSVALLFSQTTPTLAAESFLCPESEIEQFDTISARIISLNEFQRKFPDSLEPIPQYCNETRADLNTVNDIINRCFQGSAKQFSTIIMYSVKKTLNLYCSPKSKKRYDALIAMGKCITKNESAANKCLQDYTDSLRRGKRAPVLGNRLGYACCDYYKLLSCLENATKSTCTQKQTNSIQELIRNVFQSIIDVACGDFVENSDKCEKLPPAPRKKKSDKPTKTVFLPLVDLWNNLS